MRKKTAVLVRPHELVGASVLLIMYRRDPSPENHLAALTGAAEALQGCAGEGIVIGMVATPYGSKDVARYCARHIKAARAALADGAPNEAPTASQQAAQASGGMVADCSHQTKKSEVTSEEEGKA